MTKESVIKFLAEKGRSEIFSELRLRVMVSIMHQKAACDKHFKMAMYDNPLHTAEWCANELIRLWDAGVIQESEKWGNVEKELLNDGVGPVELNEPHGIGLND